MYDEAEYGDTLKSWVVPTYMLCALIHWTCAVFSHKMNKSIFVFSHTIKQIDFLFVFYLNIAGNESKKAKSLTNQESLDRYDIHVDLALT